jgi:hypothetical protein
MPTFLVSPTPQAPGRLASCPSRAGADGVYLPFAVPPAVQDGSFNRKPKACAVCAGAQDADPPPGAHAFGLRLNERAKAEGWEYHGRPVTASCTEVVTITFSVWGYIDPGSGTLLLQAALAAGLASIVCLRGVLTRLVGLALRRKTAGPQHRD